MPNGALHLNATMSENQQQQQQSQPQRPPLRRAVYIHVSDLTSAYNIDHKKLEQELTRVKRDTPSSPSTESTQPTDEGSHASVPPKRLQPPRGGFNLCVLVGRVNVVVDKLRVDRSRVRLAEVEVGDETGTVSLRARDGQIDVLEEVANRRGAVVLRNCTLELFQGKHIRLAVTKWGKLSIYPDNVASTPPPPSKMNNERNFSLIDLSLVASEMVENQPPEVPYPSNRERDTSSTPNRATLSQQRSSLPPTQNPQYHQTTRRQSRTQRQGRTRGGGGSLLGVPYTEANLPPHMRYPSMRNFGHGHGHGYGENVDLQHFQLGYSQQADHIRQSQQSVLQPPSQHLLQFQQYEQMQQYEIQQRQIQQIHPYQGQQERQRTMYRHVHPSPVLVPTHLPPNSFDVTGPDFPSLPGSAPAPNPMVVSGGYPGSRVDTTPEPTEKSTATTDRSFTESSPVGPQPMPTPSMESPDMRPQPIPGQAPYGEASIRAGAWAAGRPNITTVSSDVASSPGRMNPQAMSFAPSYGKGQQGAAQPAHTQYAAYIPYDPSQQGSIYTGSAQHQLYPRNIVYVPYQPEGPNRYLEQPQHAPSNETAERIESDDKQGSSEQ